MPLLLGNIHFRRIAQPGRRVRTCALLLSLSLAVCNPLLAADASNSPESAAAVSPTPDLMRAYLQLQEQLHSAQLAIERNRQEAETAASRNAEVISSRLKALEDALVAQSALDRNTIETVQTTNRLIVKIGSICAGVGFLAVLLAAFFQWRTVTRLAEYSVLSHAALTMRPPHGITDGQPVVTAATEQANTRLLGALDRLEKQILELEHKAHAPLAEATGEMLGTETANGSAAARIGVLLAKGESLLSLDKAEEALACYDEVLALEPDHSEALVKKGDALERLRKIDDAIECYDRAIAVGRSLTVAYLHKGGLFNRLERYEEALQCYEQALRTQEKSQNA